MSNTVVKTLLVDGQKTALMSVYIESDGVEGELKNYVLIDPVNDFAMGAVQQNQLSIMQVWYGFSWFDATLSFDDINPFPGWVLPRDTGGYYDFRYFGGVKDRSGLDHTGKLFLSTNGFAPLGSNGTLIVAVHKD